MGELLPHRDVGLARFLFYPSVMLAHSLGGSFRFFLIGCGVQCVAPWFLFTSKGLCSDVPAFDLILRPNPADLLAGFLTGVSVLDLEHGDEFIELDIRLIHFEQVMLSHQTPPFRGLDANHLPFVLEHGFIHYHAFLLGGALFQIFRLGVFVISFPDGYPSPPALWADKTKYSNSFAAWRCETIVLRPGEKNGIPGVKFMRKGALADSGRSVTGPETVFH